MRMILVGTSNARLVITNNGCINELSKVRERDADARRGLFHMVLRQVQLSFQRDSRGEDEVP